MYTKHYIYSLNHAKNSRTFIGTPPSRHDCKIIILLRPLRPDHAMFCPHKYWSLLGFWRPFGELLQEEDSSCEKMSFTSSKLVKFVHSSQVLTCFEASAMACESARILGPTLKLHHLVQWQPQYVSMPCPSRFCTNTSDAAEGLIVQKSDTNECLHW